MSWELKNHPAFDKEFEGFSERVQDSILVRAILLEKFGPQLGRPYVDTLKGSKHANMKELRLEVEDGVWRVAFAFDPDRQAILLIAGNKVGKNQEKFYKDLIRKADQRFDEHLERSKK